MFSKVYSGGVRGIDGYLVHVEADVGTGLPGIHLVGYLSSAVREAQDRVRTAIKNSGFHLPPMKVTINLSPADIRKEGNAFDLPIAIAILAAHKLINADELADAAFVGELGLNGEIKPVHGTISLVEAFRQAGIKRCFLPADNVMEGMVIGGITIYRAKRLNELIAGLQAPVLLVPEIATEESGAESESQLPDYRDVNGQLLLRRATEVAVAGQHNILYIGPAGSGKSMMARRIPGIMPPLTREERLQLSKIYSVGGMLPPGKAVLSTRPFRNPHHTISPMALAGGGAVPKPGELSLASGGVLFLDEFAEFQKRTLEVLRQPLEEHRIRLSRVHGVYDFPADFMLAAATNPCPCGFYPDRNRCTCDEMQVRRYLGRISRPLIDRIDICVEATPITYEEVQSKTVNESSLEIRKRIQQAYVVQQKRFAGTNLHFNSEMQNPEIKEYCRLSPEDNRFFKQVFQTMQLSARGYFKILKVARTIADLAGSERINRSHLSEAVGYRRLEEKYWGNGG